jgi:hypothetical protein
VDQASTTEPAAEAAAAEAPVAEVAATEVAVAEAPDAEAAVADAPDALAPVAEDDHQTPSESVDEPAPDSQLIGVMDHEAAATPSASEWDAGSDAVAAEGSEAPAETATATEEAAPVSEGSDATRSSEDGAAEPEPVGAIAEARVVMPRSTGTGSWLRWPNSTADRSDQPR